ncbi:M64 family metallopeptidase [Butyricimonas synergistica]|uniref:M64 family metallopeptidase n=1 Tax=Butyricimonas synergistica TaxID=544644 RepID=UPI0004759CAB|nr:M64 family metallopeptidase [Butyricimonas synergistica]
MKMKSFFLFLLCFFLVAACSDKEIEPSFAIENSSGVVINPEVGSTTIFSFTSAREWKASCSADWLSVSPLSGESGKATLTITTKSENSTTVDRSATLVLSSGTVRKEITLMQEAGEIGFIEPDLTEYRMPVEGGVLQIGFSTNMGNDEFQIESSPNVDWLNQNEGGRAVAKYGVRLNVLANPGDDSRSVDFMFTRKVDAKVMATVKLTQAGKLTPVDHTSDQSVRVLQTASEGNGIPIIIMGDGFTQQEIDDGGYAKTMNKACENIFTEEPIKSLRDYFDVYAVTAVSKSKDFTSGDKTVFRCKLEGGQSTAIEGDDKIVQAYMQCVKNINYDDALVIVILNTQVHAGTTYWYMNSQTNKGIDFAIAYCPIIKGMDSEDFRQVLTHEAVGHGLAKLGDEYSYLEFPVITADVIKEVQSLQRDGWVQNVSLTNNRTEVPWSAFLSDNRYVSEEIDVIEGAYTFKTGIYRPTYESMMNSNKTAFNAPSRKEIYDKVMEKGKNVVSPAYEDFVAFDILHKPEVRAYLRARAVEEKPFARPRLVRKALNF